MGSIRPALRQSHDRVQRPPGRAPRIADRVQHVARGSRVDALLRAAPQRYRAAHRDRWRRARVRGNPVARDSPSALPNNVARGSRSTGAPGVLRRE